MNKSVRNRLYALAVGLLALGLIAGFVPLSSNDTGCGSAFVASTDKSSEEMRRLQAENGVPVDTDNCDGVRSTARWISIPLLAVGAIVLAGGWVAAAGSASPAESSRGRDDRFPPADES